MKVIILTESLRGTAAHHIKYILKSNGIEIVQVVYSRGLRRNKTKFFIKKIRKAFSIGPFGVLNGFRMRKWFSNGADSLLKIEQLSDICKENSIPFAEVPFTNSDETVDFFRKTGADIGISLGNSYISKRVFSSVPLGMLNIHHEILPEYQNAQSVIWQLYNNSESTGFTIHKISAKIDGGDILFQQKVPIVFKPKLSDTIAYTSVELLKESAKGLVTVLEDFHKYNLLAKPQGKGRSYTTPSGLQFLRIVKNFNQLKKKHFV